MTQDQIFLASEGNQWFQRNKAAIADEHGFDWQCYLIDLLPEKHKINRVLELGCADGYRLNRLSKFLPQAEFFGLDASLEAIQSGQQRYPQLVLKQGLLTAVPFEQAFDLVIVEGVLCWCDRSTLAQAIAEIDRVTANGGILALGDFSPDFPQRGRYHHLPDAQVYTYKQDYAKIFETLGTYQQLVRINFNHSDPKLMISPSPSGDRYASSLLQKSLGGYYAEAT
jgi:SAM-dependent methyltransferase